MTREKNSPAPAPSDSQADTLVGLLNEAAAKPVAPVRTKDRNPANRAQWKRDRAKALGHNR